MEVSRESKASSDAPSGRSIPAPAEVMTCRRSNRGTSAAGLARGQVLPQPCVESLDTNHGCFAGFGERNRVAKPKASFAYSRDKEEIFETSSLRAEGFGATDPTIQPLSSGKNWPRSGVGPGEPRKATNQATLGGY
jgi:hypothetical protein